MRFSLVFPAYAGMFLSSSPWYLAAICFPRIRGDVPIDEELQKDGMTFSPHTRGCSDIAAIAAKVTEVFPAYAGMFQGRLRLCLLMTGFPRIRGDVPLTP